MAMDGLGIATIETSTAIPIHRSGEAPQRQPHVWHDTDKKNEVRSVTNPRTVKPYQYGRLVE